MTLDQLIRKHEGSRNKPYRDTVGKLTIGVGRNLDDVGLSDDEIDYLLHHDIARAEHALVAYLPWTATLDPVRRDVLVDMTFNMGIHGLLTFGHFFHALQLGQWDLAAHHMLDSKWATQVGDRANELAYMIQHGAYRA